MIVTMFPEPREQAKAIGVYGFVASAGGSVGLLAGGVLTAVDQLALDLLHQHPDRHRHRAARRCGCSSRDKGIGFGKGADVPGAVLITSSLMLGVYTIVKPAADYGWGAGRTLGLGAVSLALLARLRRPRGDGRATRSCRCGSSARATSPARTSSRRCSVAGMFGMFFLGALYLQRVLGYDALEIGLAFLPATLVMGTLSLRYSEPLIMRFGARDDAAPRPGADRRRARCCSPWRRSTATTSPRPAGDDPARRRRRRLVPGADDARDVGRHARRTPAWPRASSTPPRRSAARSGLAVLATLSADAQRQPDRRRRVHGRPR